MIMALEPRNWGHALPRTMFLLLFSSSSFSVETASARNKLCPPCKCYYSQMTSKRLAFVLLLLRWISFFVLFLNECHVGTGEESRLGLQLLLVYLIANRSKSSIISRFERKVAFFRSILLHLHWYIHLIHAGSRQVVSRSWHRKSGRQHKAFANM